MKKLIVTISVDPDIHEKVKKKASEIETSVSQVYEIAAMAMVDRKALLKHTGGLFKQLGALLDANMKKREIQGELIK
jgi:hypothetical protein